MTASRPSLLELAKQGDATAIAALMNHHLQPKGVTATATLEDSCLQVALESQQVPNQPSLIEFVQKGVTNLGVDAIKRVRVYGVQTGKTTPVWEQDIPLQRFAAASNVPPLEAPLPAAEDVVPTMADALSLESTPLVSTSSASTSSASMPVSLINDQFSQEPFSDSSQSRGIGAFLGRHWTVVPMMLLAALIGFAAVVFFMSRGTRSPQTTAISPSPAASPTSNSSAATATVAPATLPTASPARASATTLFNEALTVGYSAAVNTQTATTRTQWNAVVSEWQQSIELLGKVPLTDTNYATAQQKITEYERNLTYARRRLQEAIAP